RRRDGVHAGAARRVRARRPSRPPPPRRGELRRRHRDLHAREDRDALGSHGPGLSREDSHPAGRREAAAGHRGQRLSGGFLMSAPLVKVRGLRKRFGTRTALAGIALTADEPQTLVVTGPDGAGKTTLLRALTGLLEIEADEASVLGYDLRGDVTELKAK